MDTRELFQQINPNFLKALKQGGYEGGKFKELTDKINYNLIVVDELPNCVPAVRAQLFNLFDGFIEIDGKHYPIGANYCIGLATGNIGQEYTESSNDLGRELKDRMHLIIDTDYFRPKPIDTLDMLVENRNPRVNFQQETQDRTKEIIDKYNQTSEIAVPIEKYLIASYLVHGLDYLDNKYGGSKMGLKSGWPNKLEGHEKGSDESLTLPISSRAAKSIVSLSQALDQITIEKGAKDLDYFNSMMNAFKFVSAYSGILNESAVMQDYNEDHYSAIDAVIATTQTQFKEKEAHIMEGFNSVKQGEKDQNILGLFRGRWSFMKNILEAEAERR